MARRSRQYAPEQQDVWAASRFFVSNAGYAATKASTLFSKRVAVLLRLPEATSEEPALNELARAAQHALLAPSDCSPPAVVSLDLSPLVDAAAAAAALDAEGGSVGGLSKQLGKPAARALEKLLGNGMSEVTLIACGGAAQLALRLLSARASERGVRQGAIRRMVLIHPRLPGGCVNAHLLHGGGAGNRLQMEGVLTRT